MELIAGLTLLTGLAAVALWLVFKKRPPPRNWSARGAGSWCSPGDWWTACCSTFARWKRPLKHKEETGRTLTLLMFSYLIGGVNYECSQDITDMREVLDAAEVRAGFPCTVRYQPGNPQNSIVVAEDWTGLRRRAPQLPVYDDPDPIDISHLRPGRG